MWQPLELRVKNFMSYVDETVVFQEKQATIIQGLNLTDEGFENNGSGKSALLEGLSVAILNSTLRSSTTVKDLVRRNSPSLSTSLKLMNQVTKEVFTIEREVFASSSESSKLKLSSSLDKKINESYSTVNEGQKVILEKIGISRDDLLNYFLISSEKFESFFSSSDTNKKNLIGRFSNSNLVDKSIEGLTENGKGLDSDRIKLLNEIQSYQLTVQQLQELIKSTEKQKEEEKSEKEYIKEIKESIDEVKGDIKELEEKLKISKSVVTEIGVKRSELSDEIEKMTKEKIQKGSALQVKDSKLKEFRDKKQEREKLVAELELKLINSVECPECHTIFNPNSKEKINRQDIEKSIKTIKESITESLKSEEKVKEEKEELEKELEQFLEKLKVKESELSKFDVLLVKEQGTVDSINLLILNKRSLIKRLEDSIYDFKVGEFDKIISDLNRKVQSTQELIKETEKKRMTVEKKLESNNNWVLNLIKFKTHLSNKVIGVIECFINEYLERMNTDIVVTISGYKINKDGTVVEKITPSLSRGKDSQTPFATFSSGERARVEIATIFAIQKLINTSLKDSGGGKGFEFTFLDEIINSVDSVGMYNIMKALQSLEKTINVISHVVFESHSDETFKTFTVVKYENVASLMEGGVEKVRESYKWGSSI